ncbi:HesB/YadR/YfhF family protein [Abyssicoccus albus]|uniref:Uncharacterized protein YneR n=1 Tax=Abyssicoccus albus TaxID=1817405 RepID=A0A1Q1FZZ4_9BACL|nr:HesB/YadR/YfhF family protein [Abyssicoccus albus]AQL55670.1 HesB/YadR/YfhF family protein [Abyssicoccus albus]RPF56476.1 uncharacterized protein YneR [Abyssicoccus albus]
MEFKITDRALQWFKDEVQVESGQTVRFYPQIYGDSPVQEGMSLAFGFEDAVDIEVSVEHNGVTYFIEESDMWFFKGHDLHVDYDEAEDMLTFEYK